MDFHNKVVVVTGAMGGIGRAICRLFLDLGASVVMSDLTETSAQTDIGVVRKPGPVAERLFFCRADVSVPTDCNALAAYCQKQFGRVDYLVSGAGIYREQLVETMTDSQWRESLAINLDGTFYCCRAMIPLLRDGGAIVNLTSIAAHRGSYAHAHYAATKGALLSFSRSLALELAPRIRVNCVSPGLIETAMIRPRLEKEGAGFVEPTALKRLGQPEEVAKSIAFLCSDWASFITGETLHVNGGLYMAG